MRNGTLLESLVQAADRVTGAIDAVVKVCLTGMMAAIFVLVFTQVVLRYVIVFPLSWIEEVAAYLMAYLALWGSSSCLRTDSHLKVDVIQQAMPTVLRRLIVMAIHLLMLYYAYAITVSGYRFALLGVREMSESGTFALFWPRLALVTGGTLIAIQTLNLMVREAASWFRRAPEAEDGGN
jgi:TRAP-type C4-dicarboxylate transport system permease small subunit